ERQTFQLRPTLVTARSRPGLLHPPETHQRVDDVRCWQEVRVVDGNRVQEFLAFGEPLERRLRPPKPQLDLAEGDHRPRFVERELVLVGECRSLRGMGSAFILAALERVEPCQARAGPRHPPYLCGLA